MLGALLVGLAVLLVLLRSGAGGDSDASGPHRPPEPARTPAQRAPEIARPDPLTTTEARTGEAESDAGAASRNSPADFEGRGSIRGRVSVAQGVRFPANWTAVVRPSLYLRGKERAVERADARAGGEREFTLPDLPLGGYDLTIEAPGMNSQVLPVLLVRGAEHPFVTIDLYPTGFLHGLVRGEDGSLAPELLVTLERNTTRKRRTTLTGPTGTWRFEDVPDGEYRLYLGPVEAPLLPADDLSFRAPSMSFPLRELPATASLMIYTVDTAGRRIGGVKVQGFGSAGGRIRGVTDDRGAFLARYLPPGHFNISARDEEGRRGKMVSDIDLGPTQELNVPVR
ncbi:MAG: carboxypeptidase-like regulatory domain-containing protein [Planctomycetota bacterium]|nr:carboxypeptidase-like regulatory domain-containing protein [Planctomycetota bacterium]